MTRQKSDKGGVPEGLRKLAPTETGSRGGKALALAINEETPCVSLSTAVAENSCCQEIVGSAEEDQSESALFAVLNAELKRQDVASTMTAPLAIIVPWRGYGEVVTRPASGLITRGPEEPDVNSTSPVL